MSSSRRRAGKPSARRARSSPPIRRSTIAVALHTKQAPYRTYAMALQLPRGTPAGRALLGHARSLSLCASAARTRRIDYLIVGGADHKSGEADDAEVRYEAIEAWIRNLLPELGSVTHRWSGQVLDTIDYAAFSGRNPGNEHVYVHTGDSGQGLTHGVVGSLMHRAPDHAGRGPVAGVVRAGAQDRERAQHTSSARTSRPSKNFAEYVAPGEVDVHSTSSSPGTAPSSAQGCRRSRRIATSRRRSRVFGRLHASRLPSALEFVRAVLGLSVSWLAVWH